MCIRLVSDISKFGIPLNIRYDVLWFIRERVQYELESRNQKAMGVVIIMSKVLYMTKLEIL